MSTKINARIVADSVNKFGDRLTSMLVVMPRIIIAEMNTHRAFTSKNTSSSRAIPFKKMVEIVENDPFTPIAWQKQHSGMQGTEYFKDGEYEAKVRSWLRARDSAINEAEQLNSIGVTKQLSNRLLEPFMWTTMLITGSKYAFENFFSLRCPIYDFNRQNGETFKSIKEYENFMTRESKILDWSNSCGDFVYNLPFNKGQAEIHMMMLAEKMYDAYNESDPKELSGGQWHIPFEGKINISQCKELVLKDLEAKGEYYYELEDGRWDNEVSLKKVQISCGMAARTSYTTVGDEKDISYEKLIEIHNKCKESKHYSVSEHCCKAMSEEDYETYVSGRIDLEGIIKDKENRNFMTKGWCRQTKGFIPYRYLTETGQI